MDTKDVDVLWCSITKVIVGTLMFFGFFGALLLRQIVGTKDVDVALVFYVASFWCMT